MNHSGISKAFVLGAGLGTRLRPLTEALPKPLVPVWNRPLITYAFDHIASDLGIRDFLVNTHHCPGAYDLAFPEGYHGECRLHFRHEPVLLDTAGGIDNIRDWLGEEKPFLVYNGDILTNLPLQKAWETHQREGNAVTLVLRSEGDELRVGFDPDTGKVVDMRGQLQPDWPLRYQFTGIYVVSPGFLKYIQSGKIESVVFPLLEAIQQERSIGGVVIDEGEWSDLGERQSYLDAARQMAEGVFPLHASRSHRIHPEAIIDPSARVDGVSSIGPKSRIGAGCRIDNSVIWGDVEVSDGVRVAGSIIRGGRSVTENAENRDL